MDLKQIKVVAVGDSLTFGFPYQPASSWVHLVQELLGVPFFNKGINGDTTGQMLRRFNRDCLELSPSHVIITGGTNDVFGGKDEEEILSNISNMVKLATQSGIRPVIGLPPPLNPPADEQILALYRAEMESFAIENGVVFINFHKVFLDSAGRVRLELFADSSHPNLAGYRIMADAAFRCLKEILAG